MRERNHLLAFGLLYLAVTPAALSTFTGFVVTSTNVTNSGQSLVVYSVFARFNGPTDTLLNCFNLGSLTPGGLVGYWHKDNADYNSGVLSQEFGTWNPSQTGSFSLNRPFDSYLTVGGQAAGNNTSNPDPSWVTGGKGYERGWNRPDLPNNGTLGWFNSNPLNLQGRVGTAPNTATDVRIGQFVLSAGHSTRTMTLSIGYNDGVPGTAVQFGTGTFDLGALPPCTSTWFRDIDGDGIGTAADGTIVSCNGAPGHSTTDGDNCRNIANPNQADLNANGIGDVCEFARGDLNLDGIVDASDVPFFFNVWGGVAGSPADMNFDGAVDATDFSILLGNWGTTA
jgi:hypothetical protein